MQENVRPGTWPELLYRFIEHYKWEPQHLKAADFDARMRRQEVPLNFMLNLLLRCSAPQSITFLLQAFQPDNTIPDEDLEVMFPWETKATQPDVRLEGAHSRIFIEVKVDSSIKLDQVRKYADLHVEMDKRFGTKDHYLYFLTKRSFESCWLPKSAVIDFVNVHSFVQSQLMSERNSVEEYHDSLKCSGCTWSRFANQLQLLGASLGDGQLVERRVIGDFVRDLHNRALL